MYIARSRCLTFTGRIASPARPRAHTAHLTEESKYVINTVYTARARTHIYRLLIFYGYYYTTSM